ncbi:MAG: BamA/TamA family outer membrane protein [Campylobacterota bacterium]|nr:BamA/TamA family outer membrane protein [Campylobacterota bacterium]
MRYALLLLFFTYNLFAFSLPFYFKGNETLSERELYSAIGFDKPYFYQFWRDEPHCEASNTQLYKTILQDYYRSKGFYHASIRISINEERITFKIQEKDFIEVADISMISDIDFKDYLTLHVRDRFEAGRFVADKQAIMDYAQDQGYCNADLSSKAWIDKEENQAYLLYELHKDKTCHFGAINVTDSSGFDPWLIQSFLRFKEGEKYSSEKIRQSYDLLYAQGGLAKATIEPKEHNGTKVPIDLYVSRRDEPIRFRTGIGVNSDEGIILQAGVIHRNFFDNLKTLSLDARYSEIKQVLKSTFTMPLIDHNLFGTTIGYKNEHFDGYKEKSKYMTPYLQQYDQPHSFKEAILIDNAITYDSSDSDLFSESNLLISSLIFNWKYDIRDKLLEPTQGYYLFSDIQGSYKSQISDSTYIKALLGAARLFSYYQHVFGLKASLGSIRLYDGALPASYRFYAGGMNSNRAYSYRMLGPTNDRGDPTGFHSLAEATAEYRFPILGDLRGVVFNDITLIGQEYLPDQNKPYVALGTGLRYSTPIGPFAIDIAMDVKDPSQYAVHFHIGELF